MSSRNVASPDPDGSGPQAVQTTTTVTTITPANGMVTEVTAPDGAVTLTTYYRTGETATVSGGRTYPVSYTYDHAGRVKTLTTWQSPAAATGPATASLPTGPTQVTTWDYYPASGLLQQKRYADNQGPTYTYYAGGRPATRTWARLVNGQPLTTTFTYDPATGDLTSTTYSDSTPPVFTTYTRLGQPDTITDASGTRTFSYAPEDAFPNGETINGGILDGFTRSVTPDALRRPGLTALSLGNAASQSWTWNYDDAGRIGGLTSGPHQFSYTRHPDSPLLADTTFLHNGSERLKTTRTFDQLNRLQAITHQRTPNAGVAVSSNYGYTLNDANQRTAMTQPNGQTWNWGYDALGQVNRANLQRSSDSAPYPGRQYAYNYDTIGNRLTASQGDAADPATHASVTGYTPNGLNQYSTITHPAEAVASGEAHEAATVTVNGQPTTRLGPYFHKALPVPNSGSAPIETPLTIAATENGTTESEIRTALTLPATESPEYDEDGNLTADSLWTYTWDAENRLIAMESAPSLPAAKRVKLAFAYDAQSRRIRKQVWQAQPTAPHAWIATQTRRFCYDGWSRSDRWARRQTTPGVAPQGWLLREAELPSTYLILELDPDGTAFRQYLWGLDLSNTPQGAGGVSGLLCITLRSINNQPSTINNPPSYYPTYDGNGNLTGLSTATTSEEAATFTYDPFGQPLTATGPAAKVTPFGFSTKYTDPETSFSYYGFRYYDSTAGRWLGRDPLEEEGGFNLYGIVGNDTISNIDVLGLSLWNWVKGNEGWIPGDSTDTWNESWFNMVVKIGKLHQRLPKEFLYRYITKIGGVRVLNAYEFLNEVKPIGSIYEPNLASGGSGYFEELKADAKSYCETCSSDFSGTYRFSAFDSGHSTGGLGNFVIEDKVKVSCLGYGAATKVSGTAKLVKEDWDFNWEWKNLKAELLNKWETDDFTLRGREIRTALGSNIPGVPFTVDSAEVHMEQYSFDKYATFFP